MISIKTANIAMGVRVCLLLVALPALSQGPGRHGRPPQYNPATEVRVKGTVEDVRQVGRYGTHIVLKTEQDEIEIHLSPTAFLKANGFTFAKGDQIEVFGSRVKFGGADVLLAREIQKDGKTLVLRDANGIPKWTPAYRGCCGGRGI